MCARDKAEKQYWTTIIFGRSDHRHDSVTITAQAQECFQKSLSVNIASRGNQKCKLRLCLTEKKP